MPILDGTMLKGRVPFQLSPQLTRERSEQHQTLSKEVKEDTHGTREHMGEEKPHAFSQRRMLLEKTLNQANKRTGTRISSKHRLCILTTHWISWTILECLSEETSVHVEQCYEVCD